MLKENTDSPSRQNVLGALQKLSLRRGPQSAMIDGGVIGWLAKALADTDSLSEYTIEYATALLMNLSLRLAGKRACEDPALDILSVLNTLLEYDNGQPQRGPTILGSEIVAFAPSTIFRSRRKIVWAKVIL
ncbi:hypothetical protein T492DRAFT_208082 [Pavlovales sp. CCMP2436]|nr:hypothetical protein T492DRAFT_208082 [Pavlovales sp. CCMP2436]